MAGICFDGVTKRYDDGTLAVEELDLDVPDGGFTVLVGPSGCGKSTALRMLAGLEDVSEGDVRIGGRVVNDVPPKDRDIAMVFQSYALYPHMTVADNMGFALKMHRVARDEIRRRVESAAEMLGITDLLDKRPRNLSGGQRQRVALGRSVVREPQAFLMDEPLSNLDAKLRVEMRGYLQGLHGELGITTVYVTHDQTEAMTMGDRVAVLRGGRLEQVDAPQRLYDAPANVFVAGFIGSPAMNLARGRIDDGGRLVLGHVLLDLGARGRAMIGAEVVAGIRPETLRLADAGTPEEQVLDVPVVLVEALGADVLAHAELDAEQVLTGDLEEVAAELGTTSAAGIAEGRTRLTARLPGTSRVHVGDRLRLTVDPDAIHLFDADTERAL